MRTNNRRKQADMADWEEMRRRLMRAVQATEGAQVLTPEQARTVLDERARLLARVPPQEVDAAAVWDIVTFALANERYALEAKHVREVVRIHDYTPVPGAPDFLVGLFNLRGEILAVIDLRKFLGVADGGVTDLSRILVMGGERAEFGVLADAVHEVATVRTAEVLEAPNTVVGIGRDYLRGVTADALIVLDGAVLLRDSRLFIDEGDKVGA